MNKPLKTVWLHKPEFNQWGDLTPMSARKIGKTVEFYLFKEGYIESQCLRMDMTQYYNGVVKKAKQLGKIVETKNGEWKYKLDK